MVHGTFIIHHSSFIVHDTLIIIHHSSFIIHHDTWYIVHHSSFIIHHSSFFIHWSLFIIHSFIYSYLNWRWELMVYHIRWRAIAEAYYRSAEEWRFDPIWQENRSPKKIMKEENNERRQTRNDLLIRITWHERKYETWNKHTSSPDSNRATPLRSTTAWRWSLLSASSERRRSWTTRAPTKLPSSGDAKRPQRGQNEDLSKKDKVKVKLIHNKTESNRVK